MDINMDEDERDSSAQLQQELDNYCFKCDSAESEADQEEQFNEEEEFDEGEDSQDEDLSAEELAKAIDDAFTVDIAAGNAQGQAQSQGHTDDEDAVTEFVTPSIDTKKRGWADFEADMDPAITETQRIPTYGEPSRQFQLSYRQAQNAPKPTSPPSIHSSKSHDGGDFPMLAIDEDPSVNPTNDTHFAVHQRLPDKFFDFCGSINKTDIVPGAVIPVDELANIFRAFYIECGIYAHPHLPQYVCTKSQEELLNKEWVREHIPKITASKSEPVARRPQKKPGTLSNVMVQVRRHFPRASSSTYATGPNSSLGRMTALGEGNRALEDYLDSLKVTEG